MNTRTIRLTKYRAWVIGQLSKAGRDPGWSRGREEITRTKKGQDTLAKLVRDGALEQDGPLYCVTEAGINAWKEFGGIARIIAKDAPHGQ